MRFIYGLLFFMMSQICLAAMSTGVTPASGTAVPVQQVRVTVTHILQNQSSAPSNTSYSCPTGGTQLTQTQPTPVYSSIDFPFANGTHTYYFRCAETYWSNDTYYQSLVNNTVVSCQTGGGTCSIKPDSALSGYIPIRIIVKRPAQHFREDSFPGSTPSGYIISGMRIWFPFSLYIGSNFPSAPSFPSACTGWGNGDCIFSSYASVGGTYTMQMWFDIQYQLTFNNAWRSDPVGGNSNGSSSYQAWCPAYGTSPQTYYISGDKLGKTCVYQCDEANWYIVPWYYIAGPSGTLTLNSALRQDICY